MFQDNRAALATVSESAPVAAFRRRSISIDQTDMR
jgi:hypothetical protein